MFRFLYFVLFFVSFKSCHGLYCLVGKGNSSEVLPTNIPMEEEEISKIMKSKGEMKYGSFISRKCDGGKDSMIKNIEEISKNVMKKIQDGINGFQKIGNSITETLSLDQKRKKRQAGPRDENDEDFACMKIMMRGMTYRSCVPKVDSVKLKCTSASETSLCYCHSHNCNEASALIISKKMIFFLPLVSVLFLFKQL